MQSARTKSKSSASSPFVIQFADPEGLNYTALEIELIEPWDEFYIPSVEGVAGFDIVWDARGITLLRVCIEEGPRGASPIDIEAVLLDADGAIYAALERDLVEAFDAASERGAVRVLGFDIGHDGSHTTLTVVAARA